ncbi:MAG: glycosyltransferase family 2 protein [Saprospiraceae bacterium]|nr:glycosyltransferase family 2 protein [Saprospiraceae bacterium]
MRKISVILTTYNSILYIDRIVQSIHNQKGLGVDFKLELIAVDDCSLDGTWERLETYDLIRISTDKNSGGPNRGRNLGLEKATGDFICIVDHDDEWKEDRILKVLPYLDQADIVTSGYTAVNTDTGSTYDVVGDLDRKYINYEVNETFLAKLKKSLQAQNTYLGSIIYTNRLKNILFEEHFGMIDYDWILRLFHQQSSIEVCQSLYIRYLSKRNLSLNEQYRRIDYYYSLFFLENYQKEYPKEVTIARRKINGTRARYYYMVDNMRLARYFFRRATFNWRNIGYYLTSYRGANLVRRKVKILR